jgi:hypothetical protein
LILIHSSKTLDEILALPKLRKLSFASHHVSGREVIEKAIEKHAVLERIEVDLSDMEQCARDVIDLLMKNPKFCSTLRVIQLAKYAHLSGSQLERMKRDIFAACPNLGAVPLIFPSEQISLEDAQPLFSSLRSNCNGEVVSQVDIDLLAAKCPHLDTISLENVMLEAGDFRKLSALTELELELSSPLLADFEFPSQLTSLNLSADEAGLSDSDFDALLLRMATSLPNMKILRIQAPNIVQKSTFMKLLGSMTALTCLMLTNYDDEKADSPTEVVETYHATLRSIPRVEGMNFSCTAGNLPKLDYLRIEESYNDSKIDSGFALRLPGIRVLSVDHEHSDLSFAKSLKSLESVEISGGAQRALPTTLFELPTLVHVILEGYHVTEPFCINLVDKFTRLQSLDIEQQDEVAPEAHVSPMRSIDWINRSLLLRNLFIENFGAFLEPGQLEPIFFSGDQLPFLSQVDIRLSRPDVAPPSIRIETMPNLRIFRLSSKTGGTPVGIDIAVSRCPSIQDLSFTSIGIQSFILKEVSQLSTLEILECLIVSPSDELPTAKFQFCEMPSLYSCSCRNCTRPLIRNPIF